MAVKPTPPLSDPTDNQCRPKKFALNHPKNYFGVPLAVASSGDTIDQIESNLVGMADEAIAGAVTLDLIKSEQRPLTLTAKGNSVVTAINSETSADCELLELSRLKGSSERFIDASERYWTPIVKHVLRQSSRVGAFVELLSSTGPVTLSTLAEEAIRADHQVKHELLRRPFEWSRSDVGPANDQSKIDALSSPNEYTGQTVYQFKSILYHCGILTERGRDTSALVPNQDRWELDPTLIELEGGMA
jgi:hypothetical protein